MISGLQDLPAGIRQAVTTAIDPAMAARQLHAELAAPDVCPGPLLLRTRIRQAGIHRRHDGTVRRRRGRRLHRRRRDRAGRLPRQLRDGGQLRAPGLRGGGGLLVAGGEFDLGRCGATIAGAAARARRPAGRLGRRRQPVRAAADRQHDAARGSGGLARRRALAGSPLCSAARPGTRSLSSAPACSYDGWLPSRRRGPGADRDQPRRSRRSAASTSSPPTGKLVVTGADPKRRLVTELDAEPAVEVYARLVGCAGRPS